MKCPEGTPTGGVTHLPPRKRNSEVTVPSVSSLTSLYNMTSTNVGSAGLAGSARSRDSLYISRFVVLSSVKGDDGVGAVSSLSAHCGGVEVAAGREWLGPSTKAPPVNGEGLKVFAGCGFMSEFGGSNEGG